MRHRFPTNFFKGLRNDPLLEEPVALATDPRPRAGDEPLASLSSVFAPSFDADGIAPDPLLGGPEDQAAEIDFETRSEAVHSIFAPPELREEAEHTHHQLFFVKEEEGALAGLREVNALLRKGWRVANTYVASGHPSYKALVLLERRN